MSRYKYIDRSKLETCLTNIEIVLSRISKEFERDKDYFLSENTKKIELSSDMDIDKLIYHLTKEYTQSHMICDVMTVNSSIDTILELFFKEHSSQKLENLRKYIDTDEIKHSLNAMIGVITSEANIEDKFPSDKEVRKAIHDYRTNEPPGHITSEEAFTKEDFYKGLLSASVKMPCLNVIGYAIVATSRSLIPYIRDMHISLGNLKCS